MAFLLSLAAASTVPAAAITLQNPGFESGYVTKVKTGFDATTNINGAPVDVPGWANTGGSYTDSGVEDPTQNGDPHSGQVDAFLKGDDGGAYQNTNYQIQEGDTFTLQWYSRSIGGAPAQQISLFSVAGVGSTYASGQVLATSDPGITGTYTLYTLSYTATALDAGKFVGVSFDLSGGGTPYMQVDDFSLNVAAVPEPSTQALFVFGAAAGMFLLRRRLVASFRA